VADGAGLGGDGARDAEGGRRGDADGEFGFGGLKIISFFLLSCVKIVYGCFLDKRRHSVTAQNERNRMTQLVKYEAAKFALQEAKSVDEVKNIHDVSALAKEAGARAKATFGKA